MTCGRKVLAEPARPAASNFFSPWNNNAQGVALIRQGRLDEATHHFDMALRLNPDFAGTHNNMGIALARNGKMEDAAGHFKEALRLNPDFVGARNNLNKILARR